MCMIYILYAFIWNRNKLNNCFLVMGKKMGRAHVHFGVDLERCDDLSFSFTDPYFPKIS